MVIDGPFAETKEQLLGFHVVNCETEEEAIETARELKRVNPTAVYEIRPIAFYLPGLVHSAVGGRELKTPVSRDRGAGGFKLRHFAHQAAIGLLICPRLSRCRE